MTSHHARPTLTDLPDEVLLRVLSHLSATTRCPWDLLHARRSCRRLWRVCREAGLRTDFALVQGRLDRAAEEAEMFVDPEAKTLLVKFAPGSSAAQQSQFVHQVLSNVMRAQPDILVTESCPRDAAHPLDVCVPFWKSCRAAAVTVEFAARVDDAFERIRPYLNPNCRELSLQAAPEHDQTLTESALHCMRANMPHLESLSLDGLTVDYAATAADFPQSVRSLVLTRCHVATGQRLLDGTRLCKKWEFPFRFSLPQLQNVEFHDCSDYWGHPYSVEWNSVTGIVYHQEDKEQQEQV